MDGSGGFVLFLVVFAFLIAAAPIGIWNRLIKIHQDNEKRAKEILEELENVNESLELIANKIGEAGKVG